MKDNEIYKKLTTLIVLLQSFQINWQRYYFSEGHFSYQDSTKKSAVKFVDYALEVSKIVPEIINTKDIHLNDKDDTSHISEILSGIKTWAESDKRYIVFDGVENIESVNFVIRTFLLCETAYIVQQLQLEDMPVLMDSSMDSALHMNYVKWRSHVNWQAVDLINEEYLELISTEDSIVMVADIRHSQDLITYSPSPEYFRDNLLRLIEGCMKIVTNNLGIFDRVTGDGFICYFSKPLCAKLNRDYYTCLLDAGRQIQEFAKSLFPKWISKLRKVPESSIGLALGIDSGTVHYSEKDGQLFAVSDASVWATRMCNEGDAGQIIVNNIPYQYLVGAEIPLEFTEIKREAKNGEKFLAHILHYTIDESININETGDQDKEL